MLESDEKNDIDKKINSGLKSLFSDALLLNRRRSTIKAKNRFSD